MKKTINYGLGVVTALTLGGCGVKSNDMSIYSDNVSSKVSKTIDLNINDLSENEKILKIQRSKQLIGKNEFDFFCDYFSLKSEDEILLKIIKIQKSFNLKEDYIIGPETLEYIYKNYYSKENKNNLSFEVSKRLEVISDMEGYKKHPGKASRYGKLLPTDVPNLFSKDYFYGIGTGDNIENTYLNKELLSRVKKEINISGVNAVLINHLGDFLIATYVDGKLELLSHTSPGTGLIEGGIRTKKGQFKTKRSDMYYISGARDSIYKTKDGLKGAIMPYALHINAGIFAHAGYVNGDRKSHGCVRLPIFYAKGLYEIYKKHGTINWYIQDN